MAVAVGSHSRQLQWAVAVGSLSGQKDKILVTPPIEFDEYMDFQELLAYKKSVELAMNIFEITKMFPKEERYSLTDQIRRSSRSVAANLAEGYRKRQYIKHFRSKLSDCDAENSETQVWLEFSLKCSYIDQKTYDILIKGSIEVGKLINYMIINPNKFGVT